MASSSRSSGGSSKGGRSKAATPPRGSSRTRSGGGGSTNGKPNQAASSGASSEVRQAVSGREHEFLGLVLIGAGIVLGLAMYLDLAGPLGSGIETSVGWFLGIGRYLLPLLLLVAGGALVRKHVSSSPATIALGWGLILLSVLGIIHIVRTPDSLTTFQDGEGVTTLGEGGGWIGALVGGPLEALLAPVGGIVVLAAILIGAALLITQTSLRTMAESASRGAAAVARPVGRATKKALSDLSTLSSEREDGERPMRQRKRPDDRPSSPEGVHGEPLSPALYDGAEDDADIFAAPKS
ncbi:MAG: DNA translocase FtsK 4TM domain-containing protein, partial [Ilumatobacter sp.]|nr:DNA translocase FtsK 4TM domain-containing protein [Ilumatobacter sp.]